MAKINKAGILKPPGIFAIYILSAALGIIGFRFFFPGKEAPLEHFLFSWKLIRGLLDFLTLFPALAISALIIPFGFNTRERIMEGDKITPLSPKFLQFLKTSIVTAISASVLYAFISFLILPLARNYESSLIYDGRLYELAENMAREYAGKGEWGKAWRYLAVCERIWPDRPEIEQLMVEARIQMELDAHVEQIPLQKRNENDWPGRVETLTPAAALEMAETALAEERFFDSHWLAVTAERLAGTGSPEQVRAAQIAGAAWGGVNSLDPDRLGPTKNQTEAHRIFRLKLDAYNALLGGEWIRAYYAFLELTSQSPGDPDVAKYLAVSEEGLRNVAFFTDEMEMNLARIVNNAVFSLPINTGRIVIRILSLSILADSAYGIEIEIMSFDNDGILLWSSHAPYVKLMPVTIGSDHAVSMLMRALGRRIEAQEGPVGENFDGVHPFYDGHAEFILPVSWEDFILLSNIRRGLSTISPAELMHAAVNFGDYGYPREIFEAELLRLFLGPLFFLPFALFSISVGWHYRTMERPRYIRIPMLGILPVAVTVLLHFLKSWFNNAGIWTVISIGFPSAAILGGTAVLVLLFISLIILAAQRCY